MGGVVAEFMLQLWAKEKDEESLKMIKGLITLGFPATFDKNGHIAYPLMLWMNYFLPFLKVDRVPLDDFLLPLTKMPLLRRMFSKLLDMDWADFNFLINPKNFEDPNYMFKFISRAVETFPLGIGFQFQKAIFNGKGISRMDDRYAEDSEKYNYTQNMGLFDPRIPIIHFLGENDPLAPPEINIFQHVYQHADKNTVRLGSGQGFELSKNPSQVSYFIVPGTKHLDLLYGRTAVNYIYPILFRGIEIMWALGS
jgi:hypothetical protein